MSDDVAKVEGGRFKPEEVDLFKKMLATIAERFRVQRSPLPFLSSPRRRDAAPARSEEKEVPLDVLREGKGKLTNPQFAAFIADMVESRWLDKSDQDDVTYGPRSYLELADIIRNHGVEVPQMIAY